MRSIILLSVLLLAVAVLARKDDVACVVHSDDCGKCVSNGCNWCSDGYCVSAESDMCEASKVSTQCGDNVKSVEHKRQSALPCESNYDCSACRAQAGCIVCVDVLSQIFKCSGSSSCTADAYGLVYEWWVAPARVFVDFDFTPLGICPSRTPPALTSPILRAIFTVFLGPNGEFPLSYIEANILGFLAGILQPPTYTARELEITPDGTTPSTKKRQSLGNPVDAAVLIKFADAGSISAQGVAATLLDRAPGVFDLDDGTISVGPYLPGTGTGQAVSPSTQPTTSPDSNGSKGVNISKGALAGIIIGCVLGGALLIAIVAWFILRRRDAYPQAFRSPAAAYRP